MAGFIDSVLSIFGKTKNTPQNSKDSKEAEKKSIETRPTNDYYIPPVGSTLPLKRNSDLDQQDDEYRSITVHGHSIYDPPMKYPPRSTSGITWVGNDQSISVQGFTIQNPLTYWSNNNYPEASCIDPALKAEKPGSKDLPPLPYWPQYSGLTPTQRGKYLSWLSQGRNDDLDEIGYAFIFFYGLERRAILEKQDCDIILVEVQRLLSRYTVSGSFNSYLNHFTAYVVGSRIAVMTDSAIRNFFPAFDNLDDFSTKVVLSWHWSKNLPVQWDLGYSLAKNSVGSQRTNITRKAPGLLKLLFWKKFSDQFPEGISFSPEYDQFRMDYRPASPSMLQYVGYAGKPGLIEPLILPIPHLAAPPYQTLMKIWADCIEEIKPSCNKLVKAGGKITKEVYSTLPEVLKEKIPHPDLELWNDFISSKQQEEGIVFVRVSDIARLAGIEQRDALTSTQSKTITSMVRDFHWIIVPDQTITGTSYRWDDPVVIIPLNKTGLNVSEKFQSAALVFQMAYGIAASDENVSELEENYLYNFISEQFSLNPFENRCLKGLLKVLENQPPSLSKIGKRLSKYMLPQQKIALADFLGEIVLLDNKFVKSEQKALKSVLKAMEIDPALSDELIKKFLVGHVPDEPITVQKPGKSRKGEAIPLPVIKPEFSIDKEKLKRTMEDTQAVQKILASVFLQEQEENALEIEPEVKIPVTSEKMKMSQMDIDLPFPPETIPSLDVKYLSMLYDIMKSEQLSQDDFTGLARKHNLMPRAAFDDINAWADEELGDFLLEEIESRIVINYKK
jgi:uncharacterized tellurite resistance protein B-like protein